MRKVAMEEYLSNPDRYELRTGRSEGAPLCPYGNYYQWLGFDRSTNTYVRFTKSVFKKIINLMEQELRDITTETLIYLIESPDSQSAYSVETLIAELETRESARG